MKIIRNNRFFLRPLADVDAGGMTSVHSLITLNGKKLRGELHIRDCENQISLEFWTGDGAKPGGRERMRDAIAGLQGELEAFARDYDRTARELDEG